MDESIINVHKVDNFINVHKVDDFVKSIKWMTSFQEDEILLSPQNGQVYH